MGLTSPFVRDGQVIGSFSLNHYSAQKNHHLIFFYTIQFHIFYFSKINSINAKIL